MKHRLRLADPVTFGRLSQARDFLAAHFAERIPLERAAAEAGFSPFYFNRLFLEVFGETPHEFVTRRRIDEARRLLLAGNHSVTDVCFEVGYESLGSFSSKFHDRTGVAPRDLRRDARRVFGGFHSRWPLYYIPACFLVG